MAAKGKNCLRLDEKFCAFCGREENPSYGKFFTAKELCLSVHQYCMFFASGLEQKGSDEEGFDGFMPQDILIELSRGKRLKCSFCHKHGATIGCNFGRCKMNYHYPCGCENGTLQQFFGCFDAFCRRHKPVQEILTKKWTNIRCAICLEFIEEQNGDLDFLEMPCCKENFMHKDCLQRHAIFSGYFCTCPTCKNEEKFQREMQKYGIFIPNRDALWEQGDSFAELLEVYCRCDSKYCYCPNGRSFIAKSGKWKISRCQMCGHSASHRKCAQAEGKPFHSFKCETCVNVESLYRYDAQIKRETTECAVLLSRVNESVLKNLSNTEAESNGNGMHQQNSRASSTKNRRKSISQNSDKHLGYRNELANGGWLERTMKGNVNETGKVSPSNARCKVGASDAKHTNSSFSSSSLANNNNVNLKCALFRYVERVLP